MVAQAALAQALMVLAQRGLGTDGYAKTTVARRRTCRAYGSIGVKSWQVVQAEIEAPEEGATGTSLLWQAKAPVEDFRQSRIVSGRALLRRGVVVLAIATGSERLGAISGSVSGSGQGPGTPRRAASGAPTEVGVQQPLGGKLAP